MSAPPLKTPILNCLRKRRFSDEFAARAACQERLQQLGEKDGLWIYNCPQCFGWHLTSKRRSRYWSVTDTDVYPTHPERKKWPPSKNNPTARSP